MITLLNLFWTVEVRLCRRFPRVLVTNNDLLHIAVLWPFMGCFNNLVSCIEKPPRVNVQFRGDICLCVLTVSE